MYDTSVNVYCIEKKKELAILPIRLADNKKNKHVNLLYVEDSQDSNVGHFALIKNISRLVSLQVSKKKIQKHFCNRCLHYFSSSEKLDAHGVDCREMNDCAIRLPSDEKWLSLNNDSRKERVPFVVYANLECTLRRRTRNIENIYVHVSVQSNI